MPQGIGSSHRQLAIQLNWLRQTGVTEAETQRKTKLLTALLDWIENQAQYAPLLIVLIAFAEACVGIGLFVSGVILVTIGSLLYSNGGINLESLMALALLGATLGDHAGYYAGRLLGQRLLANITSPRVQKALNSSERLLRNHGGLAIFIGRFVPAIRSILPALIGISGFARLRYTLLDLLACLLWALALGVIIAGVDRFI